MRFLIVDTYYPAFLRAHYRRNPGLAGRPYAAQWRRLMDEFFGTADSYSHYLGALGHEAHEVVANCEPLQLAWADERGLRRRELEQVVLAQARELQPDVVYVQDLHHLGHRALVALGQSHRLVGQIASAAPPVRRLRLFDLILTSFPHYVSRFRRAGVQSELLRIGFDERVLERLDAENAPRGGHAAVFVGALNRRRHRRGNRALEQAAHYAPLEFWGYGADGWGARSPVRTRYHGQAWGLDMYRVLRNARIAVNRHIREADAYANNMRLYEATGVGTLLVTDAKRNLHDLFERGGEVVSYRDGAELAAAIRRYLTRDDERRAIAAAGQARTLREHTYARRMAELVAILERT